MQVWQKTPEYTLCRVYEPRKCVICVIGIFFGANLTIPNLGRSKLDLKNIILPALP